MSQHNLAFLDHKQPFPLEFDMVAANTVLGKPSF